MRLLEQLESELDNEQFRVIWLKGSPGRGKSATAKSICFRLRSKDVPVVSFFFNKDGSTTYTTSAERFASTIACQLARFSAEFREVLADPGLNVDQICHNYAKEAQLEQLVIAPASKVEWSSRIVIVLDALDECGSRHALQEFLKLVKQLLKLPAMFGIFISCRPVDIIEHFFKGVSAKHHSLDGPGATEDVRFFIRQSLPGIPDMDESGVWPPPDNRMNEFADACGGLFEVAAVRVRQVRDTQGLPLIEIFDRILKYPRNHVPSLVKEYRRILKSAYTERLMSDERTPEDETAYQRSRQLIGILITTFEPITPSSLSFLVNMEMSQIRASLRPLSPVMETRGENEPFRFYHASFPEFLLSNDNDPASVLYPISFDGPQHFNTWKYCLWNFQKSSYGKFFWTRHLRAIITHDKVLHVLESLLKKCLIRWLESMSSLNARRQYTPMPPFIVRYAHTILQEYSRRSRSGARQAHMHRKFYASVDVFCRRIVQ